MPLSDLIVADFSRVLAGPLATQQLSDLGARVIKIESRSGDPTRGWGPPFFDEDRSGYFLSCNRGKESIAVDLATAEGRRIAERIVGRADVVVENFRPGTLEAWELDLPRLRDRHSALVTCSITSYGTGSDRADRGGYDALIQATSGLMSITGPRDGEPHKVGVAVVDVLAGLNAATGIVAALHARGTPRFEEVRHVEVSLADSAAFGLVNVAACSINQLGPAGRWGNEHPTIVPYAPFEAADGALFIAVGSDALWERFASALDADDWLAEPEWRTNAGRVRDRERLTRAVADRVAEVPRAELERKLEANRVPCGPIASVDEALSRSDAVDRGTIAEHADGSRTIASPIRTGTGAAPLAGPHSTAPPHLGADTESILRELDYSPESIADLVGRKVVSAKPMSS